MAIQCNMTPPLSLWQAAYSELRTVLSKSQGDDDDDD